MHQTLQTVLTQYTGHYHRHTTQHRIVSSSSKCFTNKQQTNPRSIFVLLQHCHFMLDTACQNTLQFTWAESELFDVNREIQKTKEENLNSEHERQSGDMDWRPVRATTDQACGDKFYITILFILCEREFFSSLWAKWEISCVDWGPWLVRAARHVEIDALPTCHTVTNIHIHIHITLAPT